MIRIVDLAHDRLKDLDLSGKLAIDLTCGRGQDTLFLARRARKVIAVDIQAEAIASTRELLEENGVTNVELIQADHADIRTFLQEPVGAAIYNLGYLPHGNKAVKTTAENVLKSLTDLLTLLEPGGLILIVVYPKHEDNESMKVQHFCEWLPSKAFDVLKLSVLNKELSPFVIEIKKSLS